MVIIAAYGLIEENEKINPKILILGYSFKENCADFRNTKVLDLIKNLKRFSKKIDIVDPLGDTKLVKKFDKIKNFGNKCHSWPSSNRL